MREMALAELVRLHEFGEAAAWIDLYRAAPPELRMTTTDIGGAVVLRSPLDSAYLFNRVIGLGLRQPATLAMLDEVAALYSEAGIARYEICVSPTSEPPELADWLLQRGFRRMDNAAKCYRPAREQVHVSTDLRIVEAGPDHARDVTAVQIEVFGMGAAIREAFEACVGRSGWRFYLGYDGEKAVAVGMIYMQDGVGWLGSGATLPSHRRRGAQGAIMARRVNDAIAAGCAWVIVETDEETPENPNPSFHNMLRTGFQLGYLRHHYSVSR